MGGSSAGGPELNWWWDPEAAAIVLRQPWKRIVVSPFEAGTQVWSSAALMQRIVSGGGMLADHVRQVYLESQPQGGTSTWSMMWDELLVASLVDPSVIKKSETMFLDVDITHGPKYGDTVVWKPSLQVPQFFLPYSGPRAVDAEKWKDHLTPPPQLHPADVQMEPDVEKFEKLFVELMTR
jgi:inosine-uridine nucleoside N-ribohydrolase